MVIRGTDATLQTTVHEPRRAHARGGVGVARLLGRERVRTLGAVVVARVRLVGAEGALAAQVRGGGVGLEAGGAEAVRERRVGVEEVGPDLAGGARRAGGADEPVEVRVAHAAPHALVALGRGRREEQRRRRGASLAAARLVEAAAVPTERRVIVVREGRIGCLVAHRARLAVRRRVPRRQRGWRVRVSGAIDAHQRVERVGVLRCRARHADGRAVLAIAPLAQAQVLGS